MLETFVTIKVSIVLPPDSKNYGTTGKNSDKGA